MIKAALASREQPGCGMVTVSFPIPREDYDRTIELLESLSIGDPVDQDCLVNALDSSYSVLKRLENTSVSVDELDGRAISLDLIGSGKGEITPYGVAFDNGMELEQVYDGRHFPLYLYESPLLNLEVRNEQSDSPVEYLGLPASDKQVERTLLRAGVTDMGSAVWDVESGELSEQVAMAIHLEQETIASLNRLCRAIEPLDTAQKEKLDAVVLMAKPRSAGEVRQLAENLDQFEFIPDVETLEDYGRYMIQESGHFEYDENLEGFYDYHHFGEIRSREDGGVFTDLGYASYHGTLTLEELMQEDPAEQYQEEPEIGQTMM